MSVYNRYKTSRRQRGLTMISMVVLLLFGAFVVTCVLKMLPVYIENWNVRSILNALDEQFENTTVVSKSDIRTKITKRMNIDMISSIKAKDIEIKKEKNVYIVNANYESRVPLIGNVDVVMKFDNNVVEIPIHNQ